MRTVERRRGSDRPVLGMTAALSDARPARYARYSSRSVTATRRRRPVDLLPADPDGASLRLHSFGGSVVENGFPGRDDVDCGFVATTMAF